MRIVIVLHLGLLRNKNVNVKEPDQVTFELKV